VTHDFVHLTRVDDYGKDVAPRTGLGKDEFLLMLETSRAQLR
jgi:hypothetical protein